MKLKIKQRREDAGLTQPQLAAMLGVESNSVSRWERFDTDVNDPDTREPDWATLVRIAEALGITPGMLVSDAAEPVVANEVQPVDLPGPLANRGQRAYTVTRTTLNDVSGIDVGGTVYVDQSQEAIAAKKSDDVLLVEVRLDDVGTPALMLLQFHAPLSVMTNRPGSNWVLRLDDPDFTIKVLGVVLK